MPRTLPPKTPPKLLLLHSLRWIHLPHIHPPTSHNHFNLKLSHMITSNTPLTLSSLKALIDLSSSSSSWLHHHLSLLFTQFKHSLNTDLLNSLIKSYTNSNNHFQSILVYAQMAKHSIAPDLFTFPALLKCVAHFHLPGFGMSVHACIAKVGLSGDVFVATALLHMYSMLTRVDEAGRAFDEMPERNTVSWNAMITGYVHNRRFKEAHGLFVEMQAAGVEMGEVTMVCALSACAHLGALGQGIWIHNYVKENKLRLNVFVGTALVDMYMKCGEVEEALKVFAAMRVRNEFSWNALMSGLAMNGRGGAALEAFDAMVAENVKPDSVSFLAVLSACCHQGFVDDGRRYFSGMEKDFGLRPRIEHYGCMVDLLGRAGFLDEAHELIRTMPMNADTAVWRALLAGCRIHGSTGLGELAIRNLLELEPNNGENYVLFANVLQRDRKWSEVERVRDTMTRRRIQKVPGCSSIEIGNVVHEFVVTSQSDTDGLDETFKMLKDVSRELKAAGYIAETEMVSYDLEEEEKENSLMDHSEKLALAFGLLRSPCGSSIRIVKNLRVCKDCHLFFKLVSKVYERDIILRDRNRFHHFAKGLCSCRDYW